MGATSVEAAIGGWGRRGGGLRLGTADQRRTSEGITRPKEKLAGVLVRVHVVLTGCKVANLSSAIEQPSLEVRLLLEDGLCLAVGVRMPRNTLNRTESHTQAICGVLWLLGHLGFIDTHKKAPLS